MSGGDLAIHGNVDARGQDLQRTDGATEIEDGVTVSKPGGLHRTGEDDYLVGAAGEQRGGGGHGISAVRDEDEFFWRRLDPRANEGAIFIRHREAIFLQDGLDDEIESDVGFPEDEADLRLADFIGAGGIEINFINCPAGRDNAQSHMG